MQNQIFKSSFFLSFKNPQIAKEYSDNTYQCIQKSNKVVPWIIFLSSIGLLVTIIFKKTAYKKETTYSRSNYLVLLIIIIISNVVDVVIIALANVFKRRRKIQNVLGCVIYAKINLNFVLIKIILEMVFLLETGKYSFVTFLDFFIRDYFHFFGIVDFTQSIVVNFFLLVIVLILYYCVSVINSLIYDGGIFFILLNLSLVISSYFITKILKKNFFLYYELNRTANKQKAIMNKLNTGYIKISKGKIDIMSQSLVNVVKNSKQMCFVQRDLEIKRLDIILDVLIGWKGNETSTNIETETIFIQNKQIQTESIINQMQSYYEEKTKNNKQYGDFIFLKYQTIELIQCEAESVTYEILMKNDIDDIEFILNDITRIKEYEKKEYNVKMQNIFLTKIAHEFKNPLICIQELIDQIVENIDNLFKNKHEINDANISQITNNCHLTKSISEYLLLLIKDADYFTNNEKENYIAKTGPVVIEDLKLKDLVSFCEDVTKVKLIHLNKNSNIEFQAILNKDVPEVIQTDSMKLKQIIINLITNSIYYTKKGKIIFELSFESLINSVTFSVKDTGGGMSDEIQLMLLSGKNEQQKVNSTEIGLAIVKMLIKQLGSSIKFVSEINKGTTFWFSLPVHQDYTGKKSVPFLDTVNTSINTLKMDELQLNYSFSKKNLISTEEVQIMNIIFTDDEELARKALIRVFKEIASQRKILLNPIEAKDGIETVYSIYKNYCLSPSQEVKINAIISDQKMNYVNGTNSHLILSQLTNISKNYIPFFIVTAFDKNTNFFKDFDCGGIYSKPLRKKDAEDIFQQILDINSDF